jgi:hypothetical protein
MQAIANLGLYHAELARILHLKCGDIGRLSNAVSTLEPDSDSWHRAEKFIYFYQLLYTANAGDGVAMRHWLRSHRSGFDNTPHLMLVDDDALDTIIESLESANHE